MVGVLILALWILYVDVSATAPRMLPSPAAIGAEFVLRWDIIFEDMLVTATNALIGLVVGSLLAIVFAGLAAAARTDRRDARAPRRGARGRSRSSRSPRS